MTSSQTSRGSRGSSQNHEDKIVILYLFKYEANNKAEEIKLELFPFNILVLHHLQCSTAAVTQSHQLAVFWIMF